MSVTAARGNAGTRPGTGLAALALLAWPFLLAARLTRADQRIAATTG